jgi:hypothetical protein
MTDTPADTDELSEADRSIREIYDMEINGRRSFRRDATPQVKNVIRSSEAIPRVPVLCVSEAVREQLEESYRRFQPAGEPTEYVAPVRAIPRELWPPPPPIVVSPPPIVSPQPKKIPREVSPIVSPQPKTPRQPRERRTRVNWQQRIWASSKTGCKGVSFCPRNNGKGRWRASIAKDCKHYQLGYFATLIDAARAYDAKAIELFGPDARTNASLGLVPPQEVKKLPVKASIEPPKASEEPPKAFEVPVPRRAKTRSGLYGGYPAIISDNYRRWRLGIYNDVVQANFAYDCGIRLLGLDFYRLNYPEGRLSGLTEEVQREIEDKVRAILVPPEQNENRVLYNSTSGCKGVIRKGDKWRAYTYKDGKMIHIGVFTDLYDAARAYDKFAKELFGADAELNFPQSP